MITIYTSMLVIFNSDGPIFTIIILTPYLIRFYCYCIKPTPNGHQITNIKLLYLFNMYTFTI